MDIATELRLVEREIPIAARPETVWELLVDPEVDARVWVLLQDLLPARGGNDVGRFRAHPVPSVEVLGR